MINLKEEHDSYWLYLIENSKTLQFSEDFQNDIEKLAGISIEVGNLLAREKKLEYYVEGILYFDAAMRKFNLKKNKNIKSKEKLIKLLTEMKKSHFDRFERIKNEILSKISIIN